MVVEPTFRSEVVWLMSLRGDAITVECPIPVGAEVLKRSVPDHVEVSTLSVPDDVEVYKLSGSGSDDVDMYTLSGSDDVDVYKLAVPDNLEVLTIVVSVVVEKFIDVIIIPTLSGFSGGTARYRQLNVFNAVFINSSLCERGL